jgi:hypothetical protein
VDPHYARAYSGLADSYNLLHFSRIDQGASSVTTLRIGSAKQSDGWNVLAALVVGVGIALLSALAGVKLPDSSRG